MQSNDADSRFSWTGGFFFSLNRQVSVEEIMDPMENVLFQQLFGLTDIDVYGLDPTLPSLIGPNQDSYINALTSHDRQYAVFGEGSFAITDQLKVTAGARYSKTSYSFHGHSDGAQNGGPLDSSGGQSEKPFTPKLGLEYQYDNNDLFYFTWAKGFRIGGANPPFPANAGCVSSSDPAYNSDTVKSYEVGAKNKLFDRFRLASSAYYIKWDNIQQPFVDPGCEISSIKNLGSATVKGFDLQADVVITDNWTLETAVGYTRALYDAPPAIAAGFVSAGDTIGGPPLDGRHRHAIQLPGPGASLVRARGLRVEHAEQPPHAGSKPDERSGVRPLQFHLAAVHVRFPALRRDGRGLECLGLRGQSAQQADRHRLRPFGARPG